MAGESKDFPAFPSEAPIVTYEPTTPGDWSSPPVNAQEALDDLATAISGGGVMFPLLAPGGSVSAPSYSFSGDTNTGIYSQAANYINFATDGTLAGFVDPVWQWHFGASTSGNTTHGFFKDVDFGDSSTNINLLIGNSGSGQGSGRFRFTNQVGAGSQQFDIAFDSRNSADSALISDMCLIQFFKSAGIDSGTMYFWTANAGTPTLAMTITETQVVKLGPTSQLQFDDAVGGQYVGFKSPTTVTGTTTYTLPEAPPGSNMFLQSDSSSVLTWASLTITGTANKLGYFDGLGSFTTLGPWSVDSTFFGINCYLNVEPVGGLIKINFYEAEVSALADQAASSTIGFQFDMHVDRNENDFDNGSATSAIYNLSHEGSGDVTNLTSISSYLYAGVGTNTGTADNGYSVAISAQVGAGYTLDNYYGVSSQFQNNGTLTTDVSFFSVNCQGDIGNNLSFLNAGSSSDVTGNIFGVNFSISGSANDLNIFNFISSVDLASNFNGCYVSQSGDSNSSSLYVGLHTGDVTSNSGGVDIQLNGDSQSKILGSFYSSSGTCSTNWVGIQIFGTQTVTNSVTGLSINLNSITCSNQKSGLSINDGSLSVQSNYNTSVYAASPGFAQLNTLGGQYTVASGSPVSNTLVLANNLGIQGIFLDDMGPDAFLGTLGFCNNGYAAQIVVADTKTVDAYNMVLVAGSIPDVSGVPITDGGTITDLALIYAVGLLPAGGDINVTNMYGLRLGILLSGSGFATNTWGIYCEDTGADNWFAKNVIVGGSTGQPTNSDVAIEIASTKTLLLGRLTAAQIAALTPVGGMVAYDTDNGKLNYYDDVGAAWVAL